MVATNQATNQALLVESEGIRLEIPRLCINTLVGDINSHLYPNSTPPRGKTPPAVWNASITEIGWMLLGFDPRTDLVAMWKEKFLEKASGLILSNGVEHRVSVENNLFR